MHDEVEAYYDSSMQKEWLRAERHPMEFTLSWMAMQRHLDPPPGRILDAGGGPGRYAIRLAQAGYSVTLLDLAHENLELARRKAEESGAVLEAFIHGNAVDMGQLPASAFDAVLLMGPLYHLVSEKDRRKAIGEALRAMKPGGLIFAAFISRFAPFRYEAHHGVSFVSGRHEWIDQVLSTGCQSAGWGGFTEAYFAWPGEIVPWMESCGLQTVDLVGCEGVTADNEEYINQLSTEEWQTWVEINLRLNSDPAIIGASDHILYVGRKPIP